MRQPWEVQNCRHSAMLPVLSLHLPLPGCRHKTPRLLVRGIVALRLQNCRGDRFSEIQPASVRSSKETAQPHHLCAAIPLPRLHAGKTGKSKSCAEVRPCLHWRLSRPGGLESRRDCTDSFDSQRDRRALCPTCSAALCSGQDGRGVCLKDGSEIDVGHELSLAS